MAGFCDLCEELIQEIFSYLGDDKLSLLALLAVSRDVYRLAKPFLYHDIRLHVRGDIGGYFRPSDFVKEINPTVVEAMVPNIQLYTKKFAFEFPGSSDLRSQAAVSLLWILPSLVSVRSLAFATKGRWFGCTALHSLLPPSSHLTVLVLYGIILNEGFYQILLSLPSLEKLEVVNAERGAPEYTPIFAPDMMCPRLRVLSGPHRLLRHILPASSVHHLSVYDNIFRSNEDVFKFSKQSLRSLRSLTIQSTHAPAFIGGCENLQIFACILFSAFLDSDTLSTLRSLRKLQYIHLVLPAEACTLVQADMTRQLFEAIPNLVLLDMSKPPDEFMFRHRRNGLLTNTERMQTVDRGLWQPRWTFDEEDVLKALEKSAV